MMGRSTGIMTCHQICNGLAPSSRAASISSFGTVDSPAMKISRLMPKVDQRWTENSTNSAVVPEPSQSTGTRPTAFSMAFKLPSKRSTMLKIEPMMTEDSTAGKK